MDVARMLTRFRIQAFLVGLALAAFGALPWILLVVAGLGPIATILCVLWGLFMLPAVGLGVQIMRLAVMARKGAQTVRIWGSGWPSGPRGPAEGGSGQDPDGADDAGRPSQRSGRAPDVIDVEYRDKP